jgi:hypothetical protein
MRAGATGRCGREFLKVVDFVWLEHPHSTRGRARDVIHGCFFGSKTSCCKTAQFCVTQRQSQVAETFASAMVRKPMKSRAKTLP